MPSGPWKFAPIEEASLSWAGRHEAVEQYILQKITSGEIPAGSKLPSTAEIAAQMELDLKSVQKALMRLSARGFLIRKPNFGTMVSYRGAASANVFLLIGPCLREEPHHFDRKLSKLVEMELFARGYNPIIYDDLNQTLERKSKAGAGLIKQLVADFAHFDPVAVVEQDFDSLRIPEFARGGGGVSVSIRPVGQDGDVSFDYPQCYSEAVRAVAEHGRKSTILVLKNPKSFPGSRSLKAFWKAADSHGVTVQKILHINDDRTSALEAPMQKSLSEELKEWKKLPPRKRPDSIIFMDDILARSGALCLLREGISVPDDMLVVSLVSEEIDLDFGIPITGVALPLTQAATALIDRLDHRLKKADMDPAPVKIPGFLVNVGEQLPGKMEAKLLSREETVC